MKKVLIVQAVFYEKISAMLLEGAKKELKNAGYEVDVISVPGVFEIAAVISMHKDIKDKFFQSYNKYYGYVALGCVIRGETSHYDYVCAESARALNDLAFKEKLAIGYGILTVENELQALERADSAKKDRGGFAAYACTEMIKIREKILFGRKTE
ncbi:MAG: 6,7-dimethyl-8-ribityllumazine synthase [Proteobacteria bacterium]|nr:6,7-dimethyl-8-ribityllumazine synthase [Pseudomonadota bacterium]